MGDVDGTTMGATVFLTLLGLLFVAIGLYMVVRSRLLERRCTETARGEVVEMRDESFKFKRSKKKEEKEPVVAANEAIAEKKRAYRAKKRSQAAAEMDAQVASWRPVVRFTVGGREFEVRAARGTTKNRYKVGHPCDVHYDPAKPSRYWLAIDGLPKSVGVTLAIGGAGLIVIGVACWFVLPALNEMWG